MTKYNYHLSFAFFVLICSACGTRKKITPTTITPIHPDTSMVLVTDTTGKVSPANGCCKSTEELTRKLEVNPNKHAYENTQKVIRETKEHYEDWLSQTESIAYKMGGKITMPNNSSVKNLAVMATLNILKDSTIWGSVKSSFLGLEILRFAFHKESVFIHAPLGGISNQTKTYQELSEMAKTDITFSDVQKIFLPPLKLDSNDIQSSILSEDSTTVEVAIYPEHIYNGAIKDQSIHLNYAVDTPYTFPSRISSLIHKVDSTGNNILSINQQFIETIERDLKEIIFEVLMKRDNNTLLSIYLKTISIKRNGPLEIPQ